MFVMPPHVQKPWEIIETGFRLWCVTLKSVWFFSLLFAVASIIYHFNWIALQGTKDSLVLTFLYLMISVLAHSSIIDCINYSVEIEGSYNPMLSMTLKKTLLLLVALSIVSVSIALGAVLLLVPGMILLVGLLFTPYLAIVNYRNDEGFWYSLFSAPAYSIESMNKSWKLVSQDWRFSAIRFVIIFSVIFIIISVLVGLTWFINHYFAGQIVYQDVVLCLLCIMTTLLCPLIHALILTVIYDLQLKKAQQV